MLNLDCQLEVFSIKVVLKTCQYMALVACSAFVRIIINLILMLRDVGFRHIFSPADYLVIVLSICLYEWKNLGMVKPVWIKFDIGNDKELSSCLNFCLGRTV
jgi:hypothetical protein